MMTRRRCLLYTILLAGCGSLPPEPSDTQPVAQPASAEHAEIYVVPLDDFPEGVAMSLAQLLQHQLGMPIHASVRLPPLGLAPIRGTNQYASEDILHKAYAASQSLPRVSGNTYRLFLTTRDINSRAARLRFYFSFHDPNLNSSLISLARMLEYTGEKPAFSERSASRLIKMAKRAIGEGKLGWSRTTDPKDLMYAPIMSLDDLDRIGFDHTPKPAAGDQPKPKVIPIPSPGGLKAAL